MENKGQFAMEEWAQEIKTALRTPSELLQYFFPNSQASAEIFSTQTNYPLLLPLKFAALIKELGRKSALWKQFIPSPQEESQLEQKLGLIDPIGDHQYAVAPQLIHRYANRVLFLPTNRCPVICRYCFRKNELSGHDPLFSSQFQQTLNYLKDNTQINELIFTGGDPLMLTDSKLENYLQSFSQINHLKYIRFHTRMPIIVPSRITENFLGILSEFKEKFKRLHLIIHVNHCEELYSDVQKAVVRLKKTGIDLLTQTVLLKGVNDSAPLHLIPLFETLADWGLTPYYLHHPDHVKGGMHFYLPLEEGRKIYGQLRNFLPGWALPQYVIDIPGGEGKVQAFNPEKYSFSGTLINRRGEMKGISQFFH